MKNKVLLYSLVGFVFLSVCISLLQIKSFDEAGFDHPKSYGDYFRGITVPIGKQNSGYKPNYAFEAYDNARNSNSKTFKSAMDLVWIQRGPGNVGGRTRTIVFDPTDATGSTWFVGSVSGGIWKTTNKGESWQNLTPDLPNLSTATLAISSSNPDVIYAGTGEGFAGEGMVSGSGIFLSRDKGASWSHITSTADDEKFRYINKILISQTNDSIVLVATNKGIYKTQDAGNAWQTCYNVGYSIQDLAQNPLNPAIIYAGANTLGVLKSVDGGSNWKISNNGFAECYRVSLSVSPVDTSVIFAGVEGTGQQTQVYISTDEGKSWKLNRNADGLFINFHQQQGWFNNVVAAHPFDKNKVFIGGVYMGMLDFKRTNYLSSPMVVRVDTIGTGSTLSFVHFGGSKFGGGLATGLDEDAEVEADDFISVEIRFGAGRKQKAHRFTVPDGEGAGVPTENYYFEDYVDVPFEVWDMDNNKQLMVSFRDQDKNGSLNLIERKYGDDISGREYIFVSAYDYDASTPNSIIAQEGGYIEKLLYFMWPTLPPDKTWNPDILPESTIKIHYGTIFLQDANTTILADDRLNENLHVDHHDIKFNITNNTTKQFEIIEANDGGLGFSSDLGKTWKQINKGYLTTQFYGVAKRPGHHEYIGGMQDNGTWQSPEGSEALSNSEYEFRIEGDGFEALWHPWYPNRILGSSYNNYIKVSNDYGKNWQWSIEGINGDGPFITKLANSKENPNLVFAVGSKGLYKHVNFGYGRYNWELIDLGEGWALNNTVTSMHHVEVSKANPAIIWAGGGIYKNPDLQVFISKDFGETFDTTTNYTAIELGYISGMATHPVNPAEAFLLFSYKSKPKILRTMDYGQSWVEISGFGSDSSSNNGFPDVIINDLLVMPNDTNNIWVATEIGLFESLDNGSTWHYADNGLPPVSIWQLEIADGEVMAATHGRGIWTADLGFTSIKPVVKNKSEFSIAPNPANEFCTINFISEQNGSIGIKIYEPSGKLIHQTTRTKTTMQFSENLTLTEISAGSYLVVLTMNGKQSSQKLVISR